MRFGFPGNLFFYWWRNLCHAPLEGSVQLRGLQIFSLKNPFRCVFLATFKILISASISRPSLCIIVVVRIVWKSFRKVFQFRTLSNTLSARSPWRGCGASSFLHRLLWSVKWPLPVKNPTKTRSLGCHFQMVVVLRICSVNLISIAMIFLSGKWFFKIWIEAAVSFFRLFIIVHDANFGLIFKKASWKLLRMMMAGKVFR